MPTHDKLRNVIDKGHIPLVVQQYVLRSWSEINYLVLVQSIPHDAQPYTTYVASAIDVYSYESPNVIITCTTTTIDTISDSASCPKAANIYMKYIATNRS